MKTKLFMFALIAATLVGFSSCKKVKDLLSFTMKYNREFTIPGAVASSTPVNTPAIPVVTTNSESTFKNKNTAGKLIKEVKLDALTLTLTSPSHDTCTYNFINTIEVYMSADGQSEVKIASKSNIPNNSSKSIEMDVSGANLMEYVKADKFTLRVSLQADQTTTAEYTSNAAMTFKVQADPL
jgi:hypothetical protein